MTARNRKNKPTEVSVTVGEGTKVIHEIIKEEGEIHFHFFLSSDGTHQTGEAPVYNINVNVSNGDINPRFTTKVLDSDGT